MSIEIATNGTDIANPFSYQTLFQLLISAGYSLRKVFSVDFSLRLLVRDVEAMFQFMKICHNQSLVLILQDFCYSFD